MFETLQCYAICVVKYAKLNFGPFFIMAAFSKWLLALQQMIKTDL